MVQHHTILGKNRKSSGTSIKLNGIIINESKVIVSPFNSYFNSIPTTLSNNTNNNILTFENYFVDQIPEPENFQPSIPEITKIIPHTKKGSCGGVKTVQKTTQKQNKTKQTNPMQSNSVGSDNIPTAILKLNVNINAPILSNLINKSLSTGLFLKSLKITKILLIFKNKDKLDMTNYCKISMLYVISNVSEKVFYNTLKLFLC